jgi:hypothetical protein
MKSANPQKLVVPPREIPEAIDPGFTGPHSQADVVPLP